MRPRRSRLVPATNRRRADRVIWTGLGRVPDPEKDIPSIVVEFVSKRRRDALRDYEAKRDEYLAAGVQRILDHRSFPPYHDGLPPRIAGPTYEIVTEARDVSDATFSPDSSCRSPDCLPKPISGSGTKARPKQSRKPNPPAGGTDG